MCASASVFAVLLAVTLLFVSLLVLVWVRDRSRLCFAAASLREECAQRLRVKAEAEVMRANILAVLRQAEARLPALGHGSDDAAVCDRLSYIVKVVLPAVEAARAFVVSQNDRAQHLRARCEMESAVDRIFGRGDSSVNT